MVAPVLEEIAAERADDLTVAKLDVDANPETARDFQVVSIPTLILFKDGQPVKRIVGAKGKAALLRELSDAVPNLDLRRPMLVAETQCRRIGLGFSRYQQGSATIPVSCAAFVQRCQLVPEDPWYAESAPRRRRRAALW